jgi:glycerol-3-phosphate acyltransferase PlsX
MRIAINAMGSDNGSGVIVKGALQFSKLFPEDTIILVGDKDEISKYLPADYDINRITVLHTSDWLEMKDKVDLVRSHKESSAVLTAKLVREDYIKDSATICKKADAMVDLSNTAVAMAAATLYVGRIKGIKKPTIAINVPGIKDGRVIFLDGGAVADCEPENLAQFAELGVIYAHYVLGIVMPRVGILNIGEEEDKGNALVRATTPLLMEATAKGKYLFVGNIEADRIFFRHADVVVADGFTGNCVLKAFEGVMDFLKALIKEDWRMVLLALPALPLYKKVKKKLSSDEYGGQPLLGLNGVCIIGHGKSNLRAVVSALRTARETVKSGVVEIIRRNLESD